MTDEMVHPYIDVRVVTITSKNGSDERDHSDECEQRWDWTISTQNVQQMFEANTAHTKE